MKIAEHAIGVGHPLFLVAELGVTAGGSYDNARRLIDAVASAGCHAAKFVVTDPDKIMASRDVPFTYEMLQRGHYSETKIRATRPIYDLLKETTFTEREWRLIRLHCISQGVVFFATADHLEAVEMLEGLDVPAHKVSAWDLTYLPLIEAMRATGKPVLIDVGTATAEEVLAAIPGEADPFLFVHSPHPHGDRDWNMERVCGRFFQSHYPVGFSSPGRESWCDFLALGGGACLIEKRVTLRRDEPTGHHHAVSLEPDEFRDWCNQMKRADAARKERAWEGTAAAWAERAKYNRNAEGLRP